MTRKKSNVTTTIDVNVLKTNQTYDQPLTHQRVAISHTAQFAMDLMKVIAIPLDQQKKGGQLQSEESIVARAVKIAEMAFATFEDRGWTTVIPPFSDLLHDDGQSMGFRQKAGRGA